MMTRMLSLGLVALGLAVGCGGGEGDECSPECAPCMTCYFGSCVPIPGCVDGGADGGGDVPADVVPEADTGADTGADVPPDAPDTIDTVPDVPPDTVDTTDTVPDVPPDTTDVTDTGPDVAVDVVDVLPDVARRCGPWPGGECPADEVCDIHGCYPGSSGTCVPAPSGCPEIWAPVCGCDGRTYANDCERVSAGVALDHEGECDEPPPPPEPPVCADSGTGWLDPATGRMICEADCAGCVAECRYDGSWSEGWYAACTDPGRDAGCLYGGLIEWVDCV